MDKKTQLSFSAANVFPVKLFLNKDLMKSLLKGKIPLYHLQLNPTNVCNFKCSMCSCDSRTRGIQYEWDKLKEILKKCHEKGMRAMTITGGGEPFLYPQINELLKFLNEMGVEVGVVSNGTQVHKLNEDGRKGLSWVRISASDNLVYQLSTNNLTLDQWLDGLDKFISSGIKGQDGLQDFAFSYVVLETPDYPTMNKLIEFANKHNFTNVRLVHDLCNLDKVPSMEEVRSHITVDDKIVNYQDRKAYQHGIKNCWISLLKPVIAPDGWVYPCCGVQYAKGNTLDFDETMRMCKAEDLNKLYRKQIPFDGSQCIKCYYNQYNELLNYFKEKEIIGKVFV